MPPDILFIVLDTQRADRLGCYGYDRGLTPHLDHFAEQGALFNLGIAPAQWTIPSHASMFTGLYPTVHQVTQSNHALSTETPHLVEQLTEVGYETVGFCNNPLVGVLDNGFRRGFDTFYNYGGAAPNVYQTHQRWRWPLNHVAGWLKSAFDWFANPIQRFFGQSELAFRLSLNAWVTPLWSRYANFKGQNERSVRHLTHFLQEREQSEQGKPLFLFLNLMETHLPFWPPEPFIEQTAPYLLHDETARGEMKRWNREAYRWAAPLDEPMSDIEARVLSDLYDAEVAYQDDYLAKLFAVLNERRNRANTLTIIVGDHGDGLGEHGCVGHAFVAYQELVHVPLIVHWPQEIRPKTAIPTPVSTRRVFHTILNAAGIDCADLSLLETINGDDPEHNQAFAEIYPPLNFVSALQHRQPHLIDRYRCLAMRRAVVNNALKLIQVDDVADELFDVVRDPAELESLLAEGEFQPITHTLDQQLNAFTQHALAQRDNITAGDTFALDDEQILEQLRALGYIE